MEYLLAIPGVQRLLTDGDHACQQIADQFEVELRYLRGERDKMLKELDGSKAIASKRKLNSIHENEDSDISCKKNRPSIEKDEAVQNCTFKSVHNNSNTSTPNEKSIDSDSLAMEHVETSSNVDCILSKKNITPNIVISEHCIKPVLDDKLMPPPTMPTRKKRGPNVKKNAAEIIENEFEFTDNDKSTRKLRKTRAAVTSIIVLEDSVRMSTRSTRSSSRQTSNTHVIDTTQPIKKEKRSKRQGKSSYSSNESIANNMDDSKNQEVSNKSHPNIDHNDIKIENVIILRDSSDNFNLSKSEIDQQIAEKKKSTDSLKSVENKSRKTKNKVIASPLVPTKDFVENMNCQEDVIELNSEHIHSEVNASSSEKHRTSLKVIEDKSVNNPKKILDETVVIEALSEICEKTIDISNTQVPPQPTHCDTTITLVPKTDAQSVVNETVVINRDGQIPYNDSHSLLPDEFSEVEDTPIKDDLPKTTQVQHLKKKMKMFESPVKKAVKHFENLANKGNTDSKISAQPPRVKTRGIIAKECSQDDKDVQEPIEKDEVLRNSKHEIRSNKIVTLLDKKLNGKCNLPLPIAPKPIKSDFKSSTSNSVELLFSPKTAMGASHNNMILTSANAIEINDPEQKRLKREEQRRKREEKIRAAALSREAQEKIKQAQLERSEKERVEKLRQVQLLREEETKKKKLATERKAAEAEERRKLEEMARLKEQKEEKRRLLLNNEKLLKLQKNKENIHIKEFLGKSDPLSDLIPSKHESNSMKATDIFNKMIQEDEDLETNNASDKERKKAEEGRKPLWAKRENFDKLFKIQHFIKPSIIDKFYQTVEFVPNLGEIFPGIKNSKLQRNSSAVWRTPPRCSMMPNRD